MLHSFNQLLGYSLRASDGEIGSLEDLYFDDSSTLIRYLVVDTGGWLSGRRVLLTPAAMGGVDAERREIVTGLRRQQIEDSPHVDTAKPVSRQLESSLHRHYGWSPYWNGGPPLIAGAAPYWGGAMPTVSPRPGVDSRVEEEVAVAERSQHDPHLRSARKVCGYGIEATDGDIGHVEDFLISAGDLSVANSNDWAIRQIVIDTRNWLPGRKVVVSPDWLRAVDWVNERMVVGLSREQIKSSPEYDPSSVPDQGYLRRLAAHYGLS